MPPHHLFFDDRAEDYTATKVDLLDAHSWSDDASYKLLPDLDCARVLPRQGDQALVTETKCCCFCFLCRLPGCGLMTTVLAFRLSWCMRCRRRQIDNRRFDGKGCKSLPPGAVENVDGQLVSNYLEK
jgi:hypothetical protein